MKVYRIRHKVTGEFWYTDSRKVFVTKGAAKGSWTGKHKWPDEISFDEQNEYEIVEYKLVENGVVL
jgi:hypothetical protein